MIIKQVGLISEILLKFGNKKPIFLSYKLQYPGIRSNAADYSPGEQQLLFFLKAKITLSISSLAPSTPSTHILNQEASHSMCKNIFPWKLPVQIMDIQQLFCTQSPSLLLSFHERPITMCTCKE